MVGDGTWVGATGVLYRCRFLSPLSERTRDARAMDGSIWSSRMASKPSGGRKRKGKISIGFSNTHSTVKLAGQASHQVDRCCNCTQNSTFSTLGASARACNCRNAWRQCVHCVCWLQCKNRGAFLPRMPGEGLLGHFRMVEHALPANSSYCQAPLLAHKTKGWARKER